LLQWGQHGTSLLLSLLLQLRHPQADKQHVAGHATTLAIAGDLQIMQDACKKALLLPLRGKLAICRTCPFCNVAL
jgi:hypothetical protein